MIRRRIAVELLGDHIVLYFVGTPAKCAEFAKENDLEIDAEHIERESRDNHIATCFSQLGDSIIYAKRQLSTGDLVHECVHAAKAMLGRLGIDDEEAEAYTIEYIFKKLSSPSSFAPPEPSGGDSTVDSNNNGKQP